MGMRARLLCASAVRRSRGAAHDQEAGYAANADGDAAEPGTSITPAWPAGAVTSIKVASAGRGTTSLAAKDLARQARLSLCLLRNATLLKEAKRQAGADDDPRAVRTRPLHADPSSMPPDVLG